MKKSALSILFTFATLLIASSAHAETEPEGCKLFFKVHIDSFLVFSKGQGSGKVTCTDANGKVEYKSKVSISIDGIGLGLGTFDLRGASGSIGLTDPSELSGTYAVAEANVGVGGAVGASLGFEGQDNGLSFTGNVNAGQGFGAFLNGTRWTINLTK
jgi:hypothetical protein